MVFHACFILFCETHSYHVSQADLKLVLLLLPQTPQVPICCAFVQPVIVHAYSAYRSLSAHQFDGHWTVPTMLCGPTTVDVWKRRENVHSEASSLMTSSMCVRVARLEAGKLLKDVAIMIN